MRFVIIQLSAFALVAATSKASAENPTPVLRGSKRPVTELHRAVQMGDDKEDVALSAGSPNNEALADESSSSDLSFFPEEMDEEEEEYGRGRNGRAKSYANGFKKGYDRGSDNDDNFGDNDDNLNDRSRPQKKNASQKRQSQRDARRARDNPNRSQRDEEGERIRKNTQSRRRSNRCNDPSEPDCNGNDNFPRNREAKRNSRCNEEGNSCRYHRVSPRNEPNRRRAGRDVNCLRDCDNRTGNRELCDRKCAAEYELFEAGFAEE
mmetsp:Transcript_26385/g.56102  ORF Transcript_26385/g.56102 Transcript_26385/m.56102 type:complete len:264 (-) Transcript_26385:95-886(-)